MAHGFRKELVLVMFASLLATVSFLLSVLFFGFDVRVFACTVVNCFVSAAVTAVYSYNINSFKVENLHKAAVSFICFMIQSVMYIMYTHFI